MIRSSLSLKVPRLKTLTLISLPLIPIIARGMDKGNILCFPLRTYWIPLLLFSFNGSG